MASQKYVYIRLIPGGDAKVSARVVLCQEGWPLRQQDWPFGLQETQRGQQKVFQEEDAGLDNRII